jgi:ferredoxin--NADP+ reductase
MSASASSDIPGVPILPEVRMHAHGPSEPAMGRVVATTRCTASQKSSGYIRHVSINISGSRLAGAFRPGQAFGVLPPGTDANGQPHKLRLYSIASPTTGEDGEGAVIATTVKRLIDENVVDHRLFLGVASNYLCDLQVGDTVKVTGPNGKRFVLPADTTKHDYAFFATGTGIAPFRGMIADLLGSPAQAASPSRVVLVLGSPYSTDLPYHAEFLALRDKHPNFTYLPTVSRERQADGSPGLYVQDQIARNRGSLGPVLESTRGLVYVCGIAGMELGIFQALTKHLSPQARRYYLDLDPDAEADLPNWTRKMIHKQVRPTRRVFLEVY